MAYDARAGEYDHRVTVCKNVPSPNPDGQQVAAESEWIRRWCKVMPVSGRERMLANQTQADITYRIRMRNDTQTRTITPEMHLKLMDGTVLNIKRVFDIDVRKVELEMECNERV